MKVAKERKSSVLASNAVHHRIDSLTGMVTLFAILGANFLHDATWLDRVGSLLISLLVIKAGWGNTVSALYELADKGIDSEIKPKDDSSIFLFDDFISGDASRRDSSEPEEEHDHDHDHEYEHTNGNWNVKKTQ